MYSDIIQHQWPLILNFFETLKTFIFHKNTKSLFLSHKHNPELFIMMLLKPEEFLRNFISFKVNFFNFCESQENNFIAYFPSDNFSPLLLIVLNNEEQLSVLQTLSLHP
jgi:hypothetical protein